MLRIIIWFMSIGYEYNDPFWTLEYLEEWIVERYDPWAEITMSSLINIGGSLRFFVCSAQCSLVPRWA